MDLKLIIQDPDDSETITRRMLSDIRSADIIEEVEYSRSAAQDGDRGILMDTGALVMKVMGMGGAEFLFDILRPVLSVGREKTNDNRVIIMELGEGQRLELQGGMSNEEFIATKDRLISIMETVATGDKA
ncbi:hypothetical protein [Sedimentitalea todarodis]|uniref:Uncharacterized protein n=1 Tax=Sedimentitalea todarodis TaxID=1631240 RepID=A0ABU3VLV9_9RHOB|nr:hypothetical protein [Sedimentitalea todarodis]MDU9007160.1 hypothetical protein [Sedimentitalea todarodis]